MTNFDPISQQLSGDLRLHRPLERRSLKPIVTLAHQSSHFHYDLEGRCMESVEIFSALGSIVREPRAKITKFANPTKPFIPCAAAPTARLRTAPDIQTSLVAFGTRPQKPRQHGRANSKAEGVRHRPGEFLGGGSPGVRTANALANLPEHYCGRKTRSKKVRTRLMFSGV